jgi:hypothetical protein
LGGAPKDFFVIIFYLLKVATYICPSAKKNQNIGHSPKIEVQGASHWPTFIVHVYMKVQLWPKHIG